MTEQGRARIYAERSRDAGRHRQQRGRLKNCQQQMDNHCYRPSGKASSSLFPCGATAGIDEGHDLLLYRRGIFLPECDILVLETHHAFIFLFLSLSFSQNERKRNVKVQLRDRRMLLFMGRRRRRLLCGIAGWTQGQLPAPLSPPLHLSARRQVSSWFCFTKAAPAPLS